VLPPTAATCSLLQLLRPGARGPPGNKTESMHRALWPQQALLADRHRARSGVDDGDSLGPDGLTSEGTSAGTGKANRRTRGKGRGNGKRGSKRRSARRVSGRPEAGDNRFGARTEWGDESVPLPLDEFGMLMSPHPPSPDAPIGAGSVQIQGRAERIVESELTAEEAASMDPWDLGGREAVVPGAAVGVARIASLDDEFMRATDPDRDGLAGVAPLSVSGMPLVFSGTHGNRLALPWQHTSPLGLLDGSA